MPHQFNVGDRVRFTDRTPNFWWFGPQTAYTEGVVRQRRLDGRYYEVGIIRGGVEDLGHQVQPGMMELIEAHVEAPPAPPTTFYTLVYKTRNRTRKQIMGFEREEDFNQKKIDIIQSGGTVFASKKLKLSNIGA